MTGTLQGKRVLVTGGHRRLGRAVAEHLARQGAHVAIQFRADVELAGQVARLLGGPAIQAELTDTAQVHALLAQAAAVLGGLDLVVAAAASYEPTDLSKPDMAHVDRVLQTNARAPIDLVLQARPWLAKSADGRAVLFGDLAGVTPFAGYLAHSMAKAALHAGVRALAAELAPEITVNAIVPGAILRAVGMDEAAWQAVLRPVPMASAVAEAVPAIVNAVAYLATCPRFVTGTLHVVDGGRTARW